MSLADWEGAEICLVTRHTHLAMEPETEYQRQLKARIRSLEAENKALRAVLDDSNALADKSPVKKSAEKTPQCGSTSDQMVKRDEQVETKSNILRPGAKIQLFRYRFTGRADLYAHRWESRDGKKKGYAPVCVQMSGVMEFVKSRKFVAMSACRRSNPHSGAGGGSLALCTGANSDAQASRWLSLGEVLCSSIWVGFRVRP